LSYAWGLDETGVDMCQRVSELAHSLQRVGWKVWVDQRDMRADVDGSMARGIDACDAVVACVTRTYEQKVRDDPWSNCAKEWKYATSQRKHITAVFYDSPPPPWPRGPLSMYLFNTLYVPAQEEEAASGVAWRVTQVLGKQGVFPMAL